MSTAVEIDVLEVAREIGPLIREHTEQAERERRLAGPVVDALARAGLFRLMTPRSLGGLEVDPVTCARVIETVAGFDSAAGWALMVGNSVDWWCARLPAAGPDEIYADDPNAIIAAAFHPPIQAVEAPGGYHVSGRSPLASHIHHATWLMFTALIMDGDEPRMVDGAPQVIGLIVRAAETQVLDTWYTLGMRGTDSNDVAVDDVFVPTSRTFPLVPEFEPGPRYQSPLYRMPGIGEAGWVICPTSLAIAQAAVAELRDLALGKTPFGSSKVLKERASVQAGLARAEAVLRSARLLFYETLDAAWQRTLAGEPSTLEHKADLMLASAHAVSSSVEAVDLVYSLAGTSAIYTRSRLERHFRDVQTLRHHGFTNQSRYETAGQVYLGVPPEFGLVTF